MLAKRVQHLESSGIRRLFELGLKMKNPVDLSLGQPDFDVPPAVKKAAIEAIEAGKNRYTPTAGIPELRKALSAKLKAEGVLTHQNVMVVSGGSGGINLALFAIADETADVYLLDPCFLTYPQLIKLVGSTAVYVSTYPDFRVTPDGLLAAVNKREAELAAQGIAPKRKILIFNSPGNPTGIAYSADQVKALALRARELEFQVISDEVYDTFNYDQKHASWGEFDDQAIVIRAFSKTGGMPGWRIGYATAPTIVFDQMLKLQQFTFICINTPAQWGCLKLLETDISHVINEYRGRRELICSLLDEAGFKYVRPNGSFFIFPFYPVADVARFNQLCIERELLVVPGELFSKQNTNFRLSFSANPEILRRGVKILSEIANELC
ncbi:MAG TPA: aspartate aminotransferase [Bdellovibrionales bacterium]|nr:MAG: hypothetical protein A2Z97_12695 [Bdellovibrionales bacterium GWB1_52_6]OFZ02858.1 MAG: hypothetical protein A2X97_04605 [Bdellovibrionales bacterium GWA1_52_35]OFZ40242.1 MAG: hypothetical protein A2070_10455 [Bdellovibrionales bacterium GWC1_52_8]HAR42763.1 aspartate aminotransferase [Bdellovibrionales bacterium]HCM38440.1 aspartate aminotransferase [Bdellovibrionales bacterium]